MGKGLNLTTHPAILSFSPFDIHQGDYLLGLLRKSASEGGIKGQREPARAPGVKTSPSEAFQDGCPPNASRFDAERWSNLGGMNAPLPPPCPSSCSWDTFYASPFGREVARVIGQRIQALWPEERGQRVAILGFSSPLIPFVQATGAEPFALALDPRGVVSGSTAPESPLRLGRCAPEALPLADDSLDRVILFHALEHAPCGESLLRETARILRAGGRALILVPNPLGGMAGGAWPRDPRTPFGGGLTRWTPRALSKRVQASGLTVRRRHAGFVLGPWPTFYASPLGIRVLASERNGLLALWGKILPGSAGILAMEIEKERYAPLLQSDAVRTASKHRRPVTWASPLPSGA